MPHTKKIFLVLNILIFPVEITKRLCIYYEVESKSKIIFFWSFYLGSIILVETIATLVIGTKVLLQLKKISSLNDNVRRKINLFTVMVIVVTIILIISLLLLASLVMEGSSVKAAFVINWIQSCLAIIAVLLIAATVHPPSRPHHHSSEASTSGNGSSVRTVSAYDMTLKVPYNVGDGQINV